MTVLLLDPAEALDRARSKIEHNADRRTRSRPTVAYEPTPDFDHRLHERLATAYPCEVAGEFARTWEQIGQSLAGSNSFIGDWTHDADESLARTLWCIVRHLRPTRVIETGVARGITTRLLLEALRENGNGHLWSIDLPMLRSRWYDHTAAAVPKSLRSDWTYLRGSSRRRLPGLLETIPEIDLFVHDSAHTEANMRFEFGWAWQALRPGGALVSHDIGHNNAFADFTAAISGDPIYTRYGSGTGVVGILVRDTNHPS